MDLCRSVLTRSCRNVLQQAELNLRDRLRRLSALSPEKRLTLLQNRRELIRIRLCSTIGAQLNENSKALNETATGLRLAATNRIREAEHTAGKLRERLEAVSPMAVLNRGYAIVYDGEEQMLTRAAEAEKRDRMILQFADGRVAVTRKDTP